MTIRIASTDIVDKDILDISINLKVDEISVALPIDELHATFRISAETASLFKYNTELIVLDGEKQIGVFYSRELKQSGKNIYTLFGVSIVGILAERNFDGKYFQTYEGGYYTFREALAEIIGSNLTYVIEDESEDFDVRGYIESCSQREAVRHLCIAAGVTVYNNSGVLTFRRSFGGWWTDTMNAQYSYQPDEVFSDYTVKDGTIYSHYAVDIYWFTPQEKSNYVADPKTGEKYYYYIEKVTRANPDFPEGKPVNELYIQNEMLVTNFNFANQILSNLEKYYKGAVSLDFRVLDDTQKNYGVGFYDGEKMIVGYPAEIDISFGRKQTHGRANSITYSCAMAYYEEPRHINVNYFNESGDFLASKQIIKGKEERYTVKHPLISLVVDNRHKIIYKAPVSSNIYEDESYADPVDINVTCEVAAIQDGDIVEVYSVDNGYQIRDVLHIGGKVNG